MGYARKEIFDPQVSGVYHCISRCVRRAALCGVDQYSGNSYEHRRKWITDRLRDLGQIFAIAVYGYSIMNNHLHITISNKPEDAEKWSAKEVIRRWRKVCGGPIAESELDVLSAKHDLVEKYRLRLCSISWFNRFLNEKIARMANFEDDCTGRFWEGRYKCQKLEGSCAVVACNVYVDLNPVRAKIAKSPEDSDYTSIQQRIRAKEGKKHNNVILASVKEFSEGSLNEYEYFELVDLTGRMCVQDKGAIPESLAPILERIRINKDEWYKAALSFRKLFKRIAGPPSAIEEAAVRAKKHWFQGARNARDLFIA